MTSTALATWNPEMDYWETATEDIFGRSGVYSETLPKSGMTRSGQLYELPTLAHPITEREFSCLPTPVASDCRRGGRPSGGQAEYSWSDFGGDALPDPECSGWGGGRLQPGGSSEARTAGDSAGCHNHDTDWGDYVEAVRRWERVVGAAPIPTEMSPRGNPRLAPEFVEWMMGLPKGYVTSPEIGLSRRQQLQVLGNGVVPQQAEAAIRRLAGAA